MGKTLESCFQSEHDIHTIGLKHMAPPEELWELSFTIHRATIPNTLKKNYSSHDSFWGKAMHFKCMVWMWPKPRWPKSLNWWKTVSGINKQRIDNWSQGQWVQQSSTEENGAETNLGLFAMNAGASFWQLWKWTTGQRKWWAELPPTL